MIRAVQKSFHSSKNCLNEMEDAEYIVSGPEFEEELFEGSVAEFLIPKLKSHPKDSIIQIDEATGATITAHEFLKLSLEIAEGLIKLGLRKGDVVVLASSNNIRCHTTATGIFFSGGILSPFDICWRSYEIKLLIQNFKPKFLIVEQVRARDFQEVIKELQLDAKLVILDEKGSNSDFLTWDDIRTEVNVADYVPRKVDDPKKDIVLISCSSGSTGLPKGVALSHFSMLYYNTIVTSRGFSLDFVVFTSSLFWISGTTLLLATLSFGSLRVIPKSTETRHILECISKYKPGFHFFPTATLLQVLEFLKTEKEKYNLECLKFVCCGGSLLGKGVLTKIKEFLKDVEFGQGYGLTETTGSITMPDNEETKRILKMALKGDHIMSVGKLLPGSKIKIVDLTTEKSLGPNKIGECRILTERVMVCYYNNEEATKLAFDENGWFKTGDLAYYDEEGRLYITGRLKEIIKYRNYQISPEEVEIFIMNLPGVIDVAVIPVPHELDNNHLKALIVKSPHCNLTEENIIQSVKENFSDPKHLRGGVEFVEDLPKNRTGKLLRSEIYKIFSSK